MDGLPDVDNQLQLISWRKCTNKLPLDNSSEVSSKFVPNKLPLNCSSRVCLQYCVTASETVVTTSAFCCRSWFIWYSLHAMICHVSVSSSGCSFVLWCLWKGIQDISSDINMRCFIAIWETESSARIHSISGFLSTCNLFVTRHKKHQSKL